MLPNFSLVTEFLGNVFINFIFEKFISHKALVTGKVKATSNNQRQFLRSYKGQKLFEWQLQLRLSPKQIFCQCYFTFQIIFVKWIWFVTSFKCVCDWNVWPPGQRVEIHERIASESLQKIRTKFYEVAGHVGRVRTVVTNHIRKMFRRFSIATCCKLVVSDSLGAKVWSTSRLVEKLWQQTWQ